VQRLKKKNVTSARNTLISSNH